VEALCRIADVRVGLVASEIWHASGLPVQRFRRAKIRIDALVFASDLTGAQALIMQELEAVGLGYLPRHASALAHLLNSRFSTWEWLDRVIGKRMGRLMPAQLPIVADLLARLAETLVPKHTQTLGPSESIRGGEADRLPLLQGFVLLKAAVACRRLVAWKRPLGRSYVASGHWSRTYIRIMLLMLGLRHDESYAIVLPDEAHLFQEMRKEADVLVRYFSRYPAERPGLLIMEAMIVAALTRDYVSAHQLLLEADERLTWVLNRPGLRLRLLRERAIVLIERAAEAKASDDGRWPLLSRAALFDAARLSDLAKVNGSPFWISLANQVHELGQLKFQDDWPLRCPPAESDRTEGVPARPG